MAIFGQLSKEEISQYQYTGLFCGLVPVYLNFDGIDGADIAVRNFVPECWFSIVESLWDFFATLVGFEDGWAIKNIKRNELYAARQIQESQ